MTFPTWVQGQANPEVPVNEALGILAYAAVYGRDPDTTTGLTWGYLGGRWGGFAVTGGTLTLTDTSTNYVVVNRSTGAVSVATTDTNWNNTAAYARVYKLTTAGGLVTAIEDHRAGDGGIFGSSAGSGASVTQCIPVACSDETTALTTGTAKVTFRMPFAFTLSAVRASVTTAPTGAALVVDINEGGASILSTKLSIDATEKTSTTAATPAVISDTALADDAEITIDIDQIGSTVAGAGLKVYLIGVKA
jgi:hypothetical protein